MKLKYYLRGLGIGILVTALIMGTTGGKKLTDEEIKAKAMQLGMVEGTSTGVLSDLQTDVIEGKDVEESIPQMESAETTQETTETVEATQESTEVAKETVEATQESNEATKETVEVAQESNEVKKETVQATQESNEVTKENVAETKENAGEKVTITVHGGDSSVAVSNVLVEAGLVEDAKEYDRYLCSNGYDKRICVGTYEIEMGSDYETIAKIITKDK